MSFAYPAMVILLLTTLTLLIVLLRKRKPPIPKGSATYSGVIRVTDRHGRNMKIVQKEDGTFEMTEEEKS